MAQAGWLSAASPRMCLAATWAFYFHVSKNIEKVGVFCVSRTDRSERAGCWKMGCFALWCNVSWGLHQQNIVFSGVNSAECFRVRHFPFLTMFMFNCAKVFMISNELVCLKVELYCT